MSKLKDDIYQRMHGFKTVKRGYARNGQSEWYYIDPRYADDDKRGQIDVANENALNPRLNDILVDDIRKNPEDYYIWRTKKDDRVRGKHAAREGLIFNKHIPPEGGNPGEDYNCRCWAEPYEPEKYADKSALIDVSGILPEDPSQDKKTPKGSYTTEQGNMTTDVPVQFLKLPTPKDKAEDKNKNISLIPIPAPKPKVSEAQASTPEIVPVPTRKPLSANATIEQMLQRYILEHSSNLQQNLPQLNSANSYTTESTWGFPNDTLSPYYQQRGKSYSSQPISKYRLGSLSSSMESRGNPAIIGTDNAGGPSYGLYQIATNPGTMKMYIKYLQENPQYEIYADLLNRAGGNEGAKNKSKQFVDMWEKLSKDASFNDSQFNFIVDTHLSPLIDKAKLPELLDIEHRHPVVKDALYSISVQHVGAPKILNDTLQELHKIYGNRVDDEIFLRTLYKNRTEYVRALKESERPGDNRITKEDKYNIINKRYPDELRKALLYLK